MNTTFFLLPQALLLTILVLASTSAESTSKNVSTAVSKSFHSVSVERVLNAVNSAAALACVFIRQEYERVIHGGWNIWDMVHLMAFCTIVQGVRLWRRRSGAQTEKSKIRDAGSTDHGAAERNSRLSTEMVTATAIDADATDPGLLKKYSSFNTYSTSSTTYQSVRTFHRPHPQADKLPSNPSPLPTLVFIHGLGGSLAQFNPLLTSLVSVAPCLGIDLPGCGRSAFSTTSWDAYTPEALADLICIVINDHCAKAENSGVVLIGHSMGCSLSILVAKALQIINVLAIVGICPQATPPIEKQIAAFERLLLIPTPIFDIWRTWDRRGGPNSTSVARIVGKEADIEVKRLQERFNTQSRTAVWRRMAWGALPKRRSGTTKRGLPGLDIWASLKVPLFLVGGEADSITNIDQIVKIGRALGKMDRPHTGQSTGKGPQVTEDSINMVEGADGVARNTEDQRAASKTEVTVISDSTQSPSTMPKYSKTRQVLKTSILPSPASHALLYDPATYRTLAGLIQTFLYEHVDTRLSLGWQLQHLSTEGKWDVKNLAKWQAITPVSPPIAGIFRAMKTLREIDESHSPEVFVRDWKDKIRAVIDISHESPVYYPKGLNEGGIEYHKFPTVSKIPPLSEEVSEFINLVDRLRASPATDHGAGGDALIGVHCHYGFNRTGFFVCCYLIEREKFDVQQATDLFAKCRPPGIRHAHFLDQLFVRYCVGLKRAPML